MQVELRVQRFDPERDKEPHWEKYLVQSEPMDRVLDLLHRIKWESDGTLTFRVSSPAIYKAIVYEACFTTGGQFSHQNIATAGLRHGNDKMVEVTIA